MTPGYDPTYGTGTAPQVVSVIPEPGSTDIDTISEFRITYDMPITVVPNNSVKVNTWYADTAYAEGNTLVIPYKTYGHTTYDVTIKSPTVHNGTFAFARDYSFSFSTRVYNNFDYTPFDLDSTLCNPDATPEAQAYFAYLISQFGKKTISATMADPAWDLTTAEKFHTITGKYPAIHNFDFLHLRWSKPLGTATWIDYTDFSKIREWTEAGGLIGAGWHWSVPKTQADKGNLNNYAFYSEDNEFTAKQAVRTSRWENKQINEDLDALSTILLALQDEHIALLWRPLHEASGGWFWWGTSGAAQYKKLWVYMFNYLKDKGVNNLIWVWTCQGDDEIWYPGDEYVDVISFDCYHTEDHSSIRSDFDALVTISKGHKIVALSECGRVPDVNEMLAGGDLWSWFMPWNGEYMEEPYNSESFWQEQMSSEFVISRDDLP